MPARRQSGAVAPIAIDEESLGRLAREWSRAIDRYRRRHADERGVGVSELLALGHLYHEGDLSPTQLAERLELTTGSVTALVNRMVEAGHVERHAHPGDRRRLVVTMTRTGESVMATLFGGLRDATAAALSGANAAQRQVVADFLQAAAVNLNGPTPQ